MQASATELSSLVFKLPVNAAATASLRCAKAQDVPKKELNSSSHAPKRSIQQAKSGAKALLKRSAKGRAPGPVSKCPIHFRQLWPGALTSSSFLLKPEASQNRAVLLFLA